MNKTKLLASVLLAMTVLFAQIGAVAGAPLAQDPTPITGTIQSITLETDAEGVITVLVTLLDDQGTTQTARLSVDTAVTLGLVTLDPTTGEPVVDETKVGQTVEIDPASVIPDETAEEEPVHPIAALLASFFGEDPGVVNEYYENGFGFGVIAQAMWMSQNLNEDASLAELILDAKQSGDYSELESYLPEGTTLPTNWGQFKKAIREKQQNLGVIVSGHAEPLDEESLELSAQQGNGRGNGHGHGNGHGNGNGNGHGNGNGNGQGNNP